MKLEQLKTVCVVGAGDMGHGIAQLALMDGYDVNLYDISREIVDKGINRIRESLGKLIEKGAVQASLLERAEQGGKLKGFVNLPDAVGGAEFVIEAVPEKLAVKEAALRDISKYAKPGAIIASNTSTMGITMLSRFVGAPGNFIGTHYFNPAVLMKLVEVVKGELTSDETVEFTCGYVKKLGKELIYARKDSPGFIANRITVPGVIYNFDCIETDKIEPADIDATMMRHGLKMGPIELIDYTGIDVLCGALEYYHEHLSDDYAIPESVKEKQALGQLGKKTGQGFYKWPERGRPAIDAGSYSGRYDPDIPFFIQANESCKLLESGICSLEDCDRAMVYGFNTQGPIGYIQRFEPEAIAAALDRVADRFGKRIFRPADTILKGRYRG